jgi:hypothetical protein
VSATGTVGFIADLAARGVPAEVGGGYVVYSVRAPGGPHAGKTVQSAVSVNELGAWPAIPPHWVQFPREITLVTPNPDQSDTAPGYIRHSRAFEAWEQVTDHGQAWLAHARFVLGTALA